MNAFSLLPSSSAEDAGDEAKKAQLERITDDYLSDPWLWQSLSALGLAVFVYAASTQERGHWTMTMLVGERVAGILDDLDAATPRIVCAALGLACLICAFISTYIKLVCAKSAHLQEMLAHIAETPDILMKLEATLSTLYRQQMMKAAGVCVFLFAIGWVVHGSQLLLALGGYAFIVVCVLLPQYRGPELYLRSLVEVCYADINTLLRMMVSADAASPVSLGSDLLPGDRVDWNGVAVAFRDLDVRLEEVWGISQASVVVLPMICGRLVGATYFVVLGLAVADLRVQLALTALSFLLFLNAVLILWPMAGVTDKCTNSTSKAGLSNLAVRAVAARFVGDQRMSAEQRIDHLRFLQMAQTCLAGVDLGGIPITKGLVISLVYQLIASFPVVITVLSGLFKQKQGFMGSMPGSDHHGHAS